MRGALLAVGDVVRDRDTAVRWGRVPVLSDRARDADAFELAHPLEGRHRVAHRGRATGRPLSPVNSDARRALSRAVRDRDGRRGGKLQNSSVYGPVRSLFDQTLAIFHAFGGKIARQR